MEAAASTVTPRILTTNIYCTDILVTQHIQKKILSTTPTMCLLTATRYCKCIYLHACYICKVLARLFTSFNIGLEHARRVDKFTLILGEWERERESVVSIAKSQPGCVIQEHGFSISMYHVAMHQLLSLCIGWLTHTHVCGFLCFA